MTTPSTGIFSPGRTRNRSPTAIASIATSSSPVAVMRRAVFGASPSSARIAPEVRSRARNSSTCPSSTSTVMTAAASKYTATAPCMSRKRGRKQLRRQRADHAVEPGHAGAHRDQREHVEISGEQRMPAAHEERRTRPQHHRRGKHQRDPVRPWRWHRCIRPRWPPISITNTGNGQRPARSRIAGSCRSVRDRGASSSETCSGSSAMPQIGQLPGPTCRTSGCIGQV